ncbi:unnamed protein product [Oikopleura dioica]|uniref:Uncharacterized protein n=1 Tax=Oikopleura dioica TaxID=34765 RepID=E4X4E8_OIKDI|nr:unnamed protein product [Oikopleura dioica]
MSDYDKVFELLNIDELLKESNGYTMSIETSEFIMKMMKNEADGIEEEIQKAFSQFERTYEDFIYELEEGCIFDVTGSDETADDGTIKSKENKN